ncbi:MAG: hypothetical protein C4326_03570 [Ignavibacteria bacterium]
MKSLMRSFVLACAIVALHSAALACPTCYGAPDSPQTEAMQWAILSLLGITGSVLAGMTAFFIYLRKRSVEFNRRFSDLLN